MIKTLTSPQIVLTLDGLTGEVTDTSSKPTFAKVRTMRCHPTIALARKIILAPILSTPWTIETKDDAPEEAADLIEEQFFPIRSHLLKHAFYGCVDFGWQPFEKVFDTNRDGFQIVRKFKPLLQDFSTLFVDSSGNIVGLENDPSEGRLTLDFEIEKFLPVEQLLVISNDVEGTNWYGQSVMQVIESMYDQWKNVNDSANRFDKKVAGAHWVVHYPVGTSDVNGVETANSTIAKDILTNLQASGGIAVPNQLEDFVDELNKKNQAWQIEILSDSSNVHTTFIDRQRYLDALIVRAFGIPERTILEGQFGTKAEADVHADIALVNLEVMHQEIVKQFNWHCVNQILRLNFGEEIEDKVWIQPAPLIDSRLGLLKEIYSRLLQNPESLLQEYASIDDISLKETLGIPILEEPKDVITTRDREIGESEPSRPSSEDGSGSSSGGDDGSDEGGSGDPGSA